MSEATTVETPVAAPKAAAPAKVSKAKAPAAKKGGKRPIIRGELTDDGRRKTLRNPQILVLEALNKAKNNTLTRAQLVDKCPGVGLTEHLGSIGGTKNKYTVSLIEHKFVKQEQHDINNKDTMVYTITATGKKALEKVNS